MARPEQDTLKTRASLLLRLADLNDSTSWREFFEDYWGLIYGVARKTGLSEADAEDVVQDTMSCLARKMPNFRYDPSKGSFKAWLLNLTRWRIVDHLRKRRDELLRQKTDASSATNPIDQVPDPASLVPDAVWEEEWEVHLVNAALENLRRRVDPEKYQIFDFYVGKQWSAEKVAAHFQISVDQVYLAKHRITELLKIEVHRLEQGTT
jgi:RNA polymerase sigma-70 factor (ECF subfamily)